MVIVHFNYKERIVLLEIKNLGGRPRNPIHRDKFICYVTSTEQIAIKQLISQLRGKCTQKLSDNVQIVTALTKQREQHANEIDQLIKYYEYTISVLESSASISKTNPIFKPLVATEVMERKAPIPVTEKD